ncbi:MAG: DMT family transporter [Firmicutes bacterium]|nr:DMT family transporter [Bacillota bacterium]
MLRGSGFAVLSAVLYGVMPIFVKNLNSSGVNSSSVVFYRFFLSTVILGGIIIVLKGRRGLSINKDSAKILMISSILGMLPTSFLLYYSYNFIESGLATVIHFTYPVLVTLGMVLIYKKPIFWYHYVSMGLSILGMAIVGIRGGVNISVIGIFIALLSGVTYSLYIILIGEKTKNIDPLLLTFYVSLFSAFGMIISGGVTGKLNLSINLNQFVWLIALSIFCNIFTVFLFSLSMRYISPSEASLFSMFEPLTGVFAGVIFFGESLLPLKLLGCLLILLSVLVLSTSMYLSDRKVLKGQELYK